MWHHSVEHTRAPHQACRILVKVMAAALLCAPLLHCAPQQTTVTPKAVDGILDLRDWNPKEDGPISMAGQWRFAWQHMLEPGAIEPVWDEYPGTLNTPEPWFGQAHPNAPDGSIPVTGYGTYLLRIKLPQGLQEKLAMRFTPINGAAQFFVTDVDGQPLAPVAKQGQVGRNETEVIPIRTTELSQIDIVNQDELVIWAQLACFHQYRAGMMNAPTLGLTADIDRKHHQVLWLTSLVLGVLLITALYHFALFAQRPQDQTLFFFALFCGAVTLRQTVMVRIFDHLAEEWSTNEWIWTMRLEYVSIPLMGITAALFVESLLKSSWFKHFVVIWSACGALLIGGALLATPMQFTSALWLYQAHILSGFIPVLTHVAHQAIKRVPLAGWFLLSWVTLGAGAINDTLHGQGALHTAAVTPYCFITFVLFQSAITARNFSRAVDERDNLNLKVIQQTEALAQESQARTRAEHDLRIEAESRVMLFSDAVHHLNNPVNHIVGAIEAISGNHADIRDAIDWLIQGEEENPEVIAVNQFFQTRFETVANRIDTTTHAVERASETIALLRVLSGIDGISFQKTTVGEILALSWKRIGPFLEEIDITNIDSHCDTQCVGHPGLYSQGLEIIVSNLSSNLRQIRSIRFVQAGQQAHHKIIVDLEGSVDESEWESRVSLISHLLKPYQCQVRLTPNAIELDLLADYTLADT